MNISRLVAFLNFIPILLTFNHHLTQMQHFLSCDWGTTFFRLRYVQIPGLKFELVESAEGIAAIYEAWKKKSEKENGSAGSRFVFFRNIIEQHIRLLEEQLGLSLDGVPIIISGMASSSIGMIELPYKKAPFKVDGSDLEVKRMDRSTEFNHDIFIISGVRTEDDVLRGEETQLAGCANASNNLYIFPGTHSKHIVVKNRLAVSFKTYMTGEFFELLSQQSILSVSVRGGGKITGKKNKQAFADGVKEAQGSNLLHSSFLVRTNQLLKKIDSGSNYYYLSGLLIGTELSACSKGTRIPITLAASGELRQLYLAAFKVLAMKNIRSTDSSLALLRGQLKILTHVVQ